jgi:hypothetical protein
MTVTTTRTPSGMVQQWMRRVATTPMHPDWCFPWPFSRRGWPAFAPQAFNPRTRKVDSAARVIWELTYDKPFPAGKEARHTCGKGDFCINPLHVVPGSHHENMLDMKVHGTAPFGSRNGVAKLTDEIVVEICRRVAAGERRADIADDLGVHRAAIDFAWSGRTWSHIPPELFPPGSPRKPLPEEAA